MLVSSLHERASPARLVFVEATVDRKHIGKVRWLCSVEDTCMACLDVWKHVTQSQLPACASCVCHRHVHALHEGRGSAGDLVKIRLLRQAVNMFMGSHDMQSTCT